MSFTRQLLVDVHFLRIPLLFRQGMVVFILCAVCGLPLLAETRYVNKANPTPVLPYNGGWSFAATNIQDALDWSVSGDLVLVAAGIYDTGGRAISGLTNRAVIPNAVTLRAVSTNPSDTLIVGAPDPGTLSYGPAAVRCVYMAANSRLIGFTLTNGYTMTTNQANSQGGGAYCASASSSIISNCVITGCRAFYYLLWRRRLPRVSYRVRGVQ